MKSMSRIAAVVSGLSLVLLGMVGFAPTASAAFAPIPVGPKWVPDGPVHAVVTSGDVVYIGGGFTGGVAALDGETGALKWIGSANGDVRALAMSSDGKHLVAGGGFSAVSGVTHRKLALIATADGAADSRWKASAGGMVRDVVVQGDTAYFGGAFSRHNGIGQRGLGAVSINPGQRAVVVPLSSFNASTDGIVYALAMSGSRLIAGGKFTSMNGAPRAQLASFNVSTNLRDGWAPAAACPNCNLYWDLVVNGNTVYGTSRNVGAASAVNLSTGQQVWRTPANGDGHSITYSGGLIYLGGHFTAIKNQPRTILAALNATTGFLDPDFAPRFVTTYPGVWALAASSSRLYAGGHFTHAGPAAKTKRPYFAMFAP